MTTQLDEAVRSFQASVAGFLSTHSSREKVRALVDGDEWAPTCWSLAATQLGLQGLLVGEDRGGSGAGLAVAVAAVEELGAALTPEPFLATILGGYLLDELGDGAFDDRLAAVASGDVRLAVVLDAPGLEACAEGGLTGTLPVVFGGDVADALVLLTGGDDARLHLLDLRQSTVTVTALRSLDLTRGAAAVSLRDSVAASVPVDAAGVAAARAAADVLGAAEQVGLIRSVIDTTVAYAGIRYAFGRKIGSFQAVKHQLAEMWIVLEQARALVAAAATDDHRAAALPATAAVCFAGPAAVRVATDGLRLLGGIGYTWEHEAHLSFRRARSAEMQHGDPLTRRARLAGLLGLGA